MVEVGAHLPRLEVAHLTFPSHLDQPSTFQLLSSANRADMAFVKSIKSDSLGIMDHRVTMTDPSTDGLFSPFRPLSFTDFDRTDEKKPARQAENGLPPFLAPSPFTGFDRTDGKQPGSQTKVDASPKQAHRIFGLRNSFRGFDSSGQCPRLELDVDVDKYHTLDGLTEPLNPQNTPNSERDSTEESTESLRCYKMENLRRSSAPQMGEFNLDCFQDSPEESFYRFQDDENESLKSSKLRRLSVGHRQWYKPPVAALANHQPGVNTSNFEKAAKPGSLLRNVRFSPLAGSLSPPSRAIDRPLPSIERRQDYVASHRQSKQYRKWKLTRHANSQKWSPCSIAPKTTRCLAARIPKNRDRYPSSSSSLPSRETRQTAIFTRIGSSGDTQEVKARNVVDTSVGDDLTVADNTEKNVPAFLAVSFSLYTNRPEPSSSTEKPPKFVLKFRVTQPDLPQQPSPHFPTEFEDTTCHPAIDDLISHTCFIIPTPAVLIPLRVIFAVTHPLANTNAGAVLLYLARALLYLLGNIVLLVLLKCGVSCGCQWTPDTHSN
ncbi:uncharacterized protein PGRI_076780 [Penicillium griseofulvum]|uniref:Uncharacterized protein n=1 Tax=Penicillium patulum TaxID=5078 RepID=A0A135LZY9_PENPA|nr:uncharacterized protein PGRI_076780 [Penicillium griseofulvum]KXG54534.1 hypothetical protein PGRI_076780 [Penicillium griseofulvum]